MYFQKNYEDKIVISHTKILLSIEKFDRECKVSLIYFSFLVSWCLLKCVYIYTHTHTNKKIIYLFVYRYICICICKYEDVRRPQI